MSRRGKQRKIVERRMEERHLGNGVRVDTWMLRLSCGHEVRESMGTGFYYRSCHHCALESENK